MKVKAAQVAVAGEETRHGSPADEEGREKLATWNRAMTHGGDKRETVMVGIRMDADGRELLTWALVKLAKPRDHVVGLHVLPGSSTAACAIRWGYGWMPTAGSCFKSRFGGSRFFSVAHRTDSDGSTTSSCLPLILLIRSFDSVLAAYEGFCSLKQIDLKLKICHGSSLRKVLVTEVNNFTATKLVLGVARNARAIRFMRNVSEEGIFRQRVGWVYGAHVTSRSARKGKSHLGRIS